MTVSSLRSSRHSLFTGIVLLILVLLPSCREEPPALWNERNSLRPSSAPPICDRGEAAPLLRAVEFSLKYLDTGRGAPVVWLGERAVPRHRMIATLTDFRDQLRRRGLGPEFFEHIRNHYDFYTPPVDGALVTGYYEAQVNGARKPSRKYAHPVYRTPRDLLRIDLSKFYFFPAHRGLPSVLRGRLSGDGRILPYHTREEIDSHGRLKGLGLELLWVDDPVDLFFLHIQGSGVVVFEDGSRQRIGYADSNGHPYRAIGRILIEQDKMTYENMSMQSIREYIRRHPREMQALFNENPSYIFFRPLHTGPLGSIDVPVTPLRSVATDSRLFPPGALCYLRTELPRFGWKQGDPGSPFNPFCGFVLNQDTGGAIKGPGRLDLFVGAGPRSEWIAGHMKQRGTVYFLIKKTD